ncbi:MAG: zraR 8 [Gemmataceae bacterium]|nr:zraR 8 [Gemmataceae bacterium]
MAERRVLVSWIGHADLLAMGDDLGDEGKDLLALARVTGKYGEKPGPLKTAVLSGMFDQIHLLSNYPELVHKPFAAWLGGKPTIHPVELIDPTDYLKVYEAADGVLRRVAASLKPPTGRDLCILLSPGTPAMAVVWVLLGASRYPATFYQTFRGAVREARMPTDLFEGIVPDLIRDRDLAFQALAASSPRDVQGFEDILGESPAIRVAVGRARRAALRDVPVLLLGESGSGKEMFATAIHKASPRRTGPFRAVNCAAIPRELLEGELFGHAKGGFTGADRDKPGLFQEADGGTLLLDEVGECDPLLQAKLLRVLQPPADKGPCHRVFRPVGGTKDLTSDVRVVAATNRDLQKEIKAGRFREDLFYRLAVITVSLPPLRDRREDVPLLAGQFLEKINGEFRQQDRSYRPKRMAASALAYVKRHPWPGNVRQLYNAILQAAVMTDGEVIERRDLAAAVGNLAGGRSADALDCPLGDGFDVEEHVNDIRRHYLRRAMEQARGNKSQAARLLGMKHYQTLDGQLERLGVKWSAGEAE